MLSAAIAPKRRRGPAPHRASDELDPMVLTRSDLALFRVPLSQPHPGATTVLVDEFDAGRLECPPYC